MCHESDAFRDPTPVHTSNSTRLKHASCGFMSKDQWAEALTTQRRHKHGPRSSDNTCADSCRLCCFTNFSWMKTLKLHSPRNSWKLRSLRPTADIPMFLQTQLTYRHTPALHTVTRSAGLTPTPDQCWWKRASDHIHDNTERAAGTFLWRSQKRKRRSPFGDGRKKSGTTSFLFRSRKTESHWISDSVSVESVKLTLWSQWC